MSEAHYAMHPGGKAWREDVSEQLDGGVRGLPLGWGGGLAWKAGTSVFCNGLWVSRPASWTLISCKHSAVILGAPVRMRRGEPGFQSQWESPSWVRYLLPGDSSWHQIQSSFLNPCESRTLMSESYSWTLEWPEVYHKVFCSLLPTPGSSLIYFLSLCWRKTKVISDISFQVLSISRLYDLPGVQLLLFQKECGSALWKGCQAAGSPRSSSTTLTIPSATPPHISPSCPQRAAGMACGRASSCVLGVCDGSFSVASHSGGYFHFLPPAPWLEFA